MTEPMQIKFDADHASARNAMEKLHSYALRLTNAPDFLFSIKLFGEEALMDLIKRGNRVTQDQAVMLTAGVHNGRLEISLEDAGGWFRNGFFEIP